MKKAKVEDALLKIADHYCYICHQRFFLLCGTPQVKVGGCCVGIDYKGRRYLLPLHAHLNCYVSREIKRKQSIIPDEIFRGMVKDFCQSEIKGIKSYFKEVAENKWKVDTKADEYRLQILERWLTEVRE